MDIQALLDLITENALIVQLSRGPTPVCDDPNDVMFLRAAMAGEAHYLVSGDRVLLKVGFYPGGRVLTPKKFLEVTDLEPIPKVLKL